jgi:MoxR-like ATPase
MIYTLLAKGHILLEGVPGLAKSLAVETFARVIGGNFKRFQFTPDKMPSDITGTMVWNEKDKRFDFYFGPIFCNIFLADEINRASPKVQSALLQAMQEKEVRLNACVTTFRIRSWFWQRKTLLSRSVPIRLLNPRLTVSW